MYSRLARPIGTQREYFDCMSLKRAGKLPNRREPQSSVQLSRGEVPPADVETDRALQLRHHFHQQRPRYPSAAVRRMNEEPGDVVVLVTAEPDHASVLHGNKDRGVSEERQSG